MFAIPSFRSIDNEHDLYIGKDCMKKLWILKKARNEDNFKKKKNDFINKRASGM